MIRADPCIDAPKFMRPIDRFLDSICIRVWATILVVHRNISANDINAWIGCSKRQLTLGFMRRDPVVGVQIDHPLAFASEDGAVITARTAQVLLVLENTNPGVSETPYDIDGVIPRAIVDDDDFKVLH